jgi:hypothetical protein
MRGIDSPAASASFSPAMPWANPSRIRRRNSASAASNASRRRSRGCAGSVGGAGAATLSAEKANGGRKKVVIASVVAAIVLAAAGIGLLLKNNHDTDWRTAAIASTSSSKAAADDAAAAAEADRVRRETETARAKRAAAVKEIEASIKTLAEKHVADGLFDGPVLSVSCDPVGGGSTDDLTAKTTVFDCFAATN